MMEYSGKRDKFDVLIPWRLVSCYEARRRAMVHGGQHVPLRFVTGAALCALTDGKVQEWIEGVKP